MKIGFDYWQVVSHYPNETGVLADSLYLAGHDVHVISAIGKQRIGTIADEVCKIWGDFRREKIHEVVFDNPIQSPELKLAKCKELGITVFFDDREDVCRLLNKNGIMAMRVTRKDNSTYDLGAERS
jgi:acid phosphatase class B